MADNVLPQCRFCKTGKPIRFLDLGMQPPANSFLTEEMLSAEEKKYPLDVYFCPDCGILQIGTVVPPEDIFTDYVYYSGTSTTVREHAEWLASTLWKQFGFDKLSGYNPKVLEIASNDGTVLEAFRKRTPVVLGVEPAANCANVAIENGIPTVIDFFNADSAKRIVEQRCVFDLIIARHVFAHVPDIHPFVEGMKIALSKGGVIAVESPYMPDMVYGNEYDTIYHEHVYYLSLRPMAKLFAQHDLEIFDCIPITIQGGSLIYLVGHPGEHEKTNRYITMLNDEYVDGYDKLDTYRNFAKNAFMSRIMLMRLLKKIKAEGGRIAAYGAAAKGNTLLNYCGVKPDLIDYIVDKSPYKVGKYAPGTHIPVKSIDEFRKDNPDYVLVLSWNFLPEIRKQEAEYLKKGGAFIIPVPKPRVVTALAYPEMLVDNHDE